MMMIVTPMTKRTVLMTKMTLMRTMMILMEQGALKLADPQWGSVRRHFDHSITITPQTHPL